MLSHFEARPATEADLPALLALHVDHDVAVAGEVETDEDDIRHLWALDGVDPASDTLALFDGERAVGYAVLWPSGEPGAFDAEIRTLPAQPDDRAAAQLLAFLESRARSRMDDPVLGVFAGGGDTRLLGLLQSGGYRPHRYFPLMTIALGEHADRPRWPEGIAVRSFEPGRDDRTVHEVYVEAFTDHWHFTRSTFETWAARSTARENFDPRLWFVAEAGSEPVGVLLAYPYDDLAWVQTVAVRREWRGRGLGLALLRHAFARFIDLGFTRAELEVDADNATGAARLYLRAGMTEKRRFLSMARSLS